MLLCPFCFLAHYLNHYYGAKNGIRGGIINVMGSKDVTNVHHSELSKSTVATSVFHSLKVLGPSFALRTEIVDRALIILILIRRLYFISLLFLFEISSSFSKAFD